MLSKIISHGGMSADTFWIHLFPHTLKDGAREWLQSLLTGSIMSWNDIVQKYTIKFHFESIKFKIKPTLQTERPWGLPKAWERFKDLFRKRSNLNIPKQAHVFVFYCRLCLEDRNMAYDLAGSSVIKMDIDDVHELF